MIEEKWSLAGNKVNVAEIAQKYNLDIIIAKLITNRNILQDVDIKSYIKPVYENFNDPTGLKDLSKAVDIINTKIKENKKIRIVGDYDVDGVVSTYVLMKGLSRCGADVDYQIPDRIKDGYGINKSIIEIAHNDNVDTIITCDNGIAAIEQIAYAKELGMTVIVTDHHDVAFVENEDNTRTYITPSADAVVNPKQQDCNYAFDKICGAGVAFKLIEQLHKLNNIEKEETYKLIEFVAIATVCDVVDLVNENRIFVKNGLEMINNTNNIGLIELIKASGLEGKTITGYHLGFVIGPCINASGRLDSAQKGLELLLSTDQEKAEMLACEIVALNTERKEMTLKGVDRAVEIIESNNLLKNPILVVYIENIHESLAGIIAGRIKEKYNRPTIILTKSEEGVKGSARSIEEYNIFEGLVANKQYLSKFGGHPMAAGLSLTQENISNLREGLNQNHNLTNEDLKRKIKMDLLLPLTEVSMDFIDKLETLEPFGKGNNKPTFGIKDASIISARVMGRDKNVIKLRLSVNGYSGIDAMIFKDKMEEFEEKIINKYGRDTLEKLYNSANNDIKMDFSYYPTINEYNGNKSVQIIINNIR